MYKYREANTWLDNIDLEIMPYVDNVEWVNRYPTLSALIMSEAKKQELQDISSGLVAALSRLVEMLRSKSAKMPFDLFNMTDKLTPFIEEDNSQCVSYITRLDFVKDLQGVYKLVEVNADTPCAMPETFYANKLAEAYFAKMHNLDLVARSSGEELAEPFLALLVKKSIVIANKYALPLLLMQPMMKTGQMLNLFLIRCVRCYVSRICLWSSVVVLFLSIN